jgi:hypothetical protein
MDDLTMAPQVDPSAWPHGTLFPVDHATHVFYCNINHAGEKERRSYFSFFNEISRKRNPNTLLVSGVCFKWDKGVI